MTTLRRALMALLVSAAVTVPAGAGDDFASSPLGRELISVGLRFLDNPGDFFYNLHADNEDSSPVPPDRRGSLRTNFFPTTFPLTWANLAAKVRVVGERGYRPQLDLTGSYGDLLALRSVSGDVEPRFSDYSIGITASKQLEKETRIFGGLKYSAVVMDVTFSTPVVLGEFNMDALHFTFSDTVLFSGIRHETSKDHAVIAQVGYGLKYNKVMARVVSSHKHLELGLDIFPEGLFVFHPFLAWHWLF